MSCMSETCPSGIPHVRSTRTVALARTVQELEEHQSHRGWDAPVAVFALVRTADALATPLDPEALEQARTDPEALTAIEQEGLPAAAGLEDLLSQLAWPEGVDGVAVAVERVMLPPRASQDAAAITDEAERAAYLAGRADKDDVRIVVGVLRGGETWCALRTRSHDSPDAVAQGPRLASGWWSPTRGACGAAVAGLPGPRVP